MRDVIIKLAEIDRIKPEYQAEFFELVDRFPQEHLAEVADTLKKIHQTNVGAQQSRQALLVMANGDINRFREYFEKWKIYDPRDFLLMSWETSERRQKSKTAKEE